MTIFENAVNELQSVRKQHIREAEQRYDDALKNKDFQDLETKIRAITPLYAKAKVFRDTAKQAEYRKQYDALEKKRTTLLKKLGISEAAFQPRFDCDKCGDTGFADGKACACLNQRIIRILEKNSGLPERKLNSFADSDLSGFSEADRAFLAPLYEKMAVYAEKFPEVAKCDLLFLGPAGCGKTFLINAIADAVGKRGFTVLYTTAFSLNNLFLKYHTTFDADKTVYMDNLLQCDLLIIDDLGTEPILKNVTQEYLFSVINERMVSARATVVSTNLTLTELSERYGERTASRLYNKGNTLTIQFKTSNLRRK